MPMLDKQTLNELMTLSGELSGDAGWNPASVLLALTKLVERAWHDGAGRPPQHVQGAAMSQVVAYLSSLGFDQCDLDFNGAEPDPWHVEMWRSTRNRGARVASVHLPVTGNYPLLTDDELRTLAERLVSVRAVAPTVRADDVVAAIKAQTVWE